MMDSILPIKGFPGYTVRGVDVHSKRGTKRLKTQTDDVVTLKCDDGTYRHFSRGKVVWCARHGVNPMDVPRHKYSFSFRGDEVLCEFYADKCKKVQALINSRKKERIRKDYELLIEFAEHVLLMLDGDRRTEHEIYKILRNNVDDVAGYARKFVGYKRADEFAMLAADMTFDRIKQLEKCIPNPVAYMKILVRKMVKEHYQTKKMDIKDLESEI